MSEDPTSKERPPLTSASTCVYEPWRECHECEPFILIFYGVFDVCQVDGGFGDGIRCVTINPFRHAGEFRIANSTADSNDLLCLPLFQ